VLEMCDLLLAHASDQSSGPNPRAVDSVARHATGSTLRGVAIIASLRKLQPNGAATCILTDLQYVA
jgi:hypothetical protein